MHQEHKRHIFRSKLLLYVLLGILLLFAANFGRAYYQNLMVKKEISELEDEVRQLEKKKLESLEILKYVASDSYAEEAARTELHLQKEGEKVLIVQDQETSEQPEGIKQPLLANPIKWILYFTSHENPDSKK